MDYVLFIYSDNGFLIRGNCIGILGHRAKRERGIWQMAIGGGSNIESDLILIVWELEITEGWENGRNRQELRLK